jgi:hypothetical protein
VVAYVRTVNTASGATAVQIVYSNRRGSREIEHIGSAGTPAEVEVLKTVARQRLHANQDTLDLDDNQLGDEEAPIVSSQARHLWEVLFPLQVHAFDGNTAETKTILPVVKAFAAAHHLPEVTVVADAGMLSEVNLAAIEDAGLRFIVGARIPDVPYQVSQWRRTHPEQPIPDGQVFVQPWVMGTKTGPRRRTIFYHYRADRARRTLKGIDQQIAKAEEAVAGKTTVKRNRFVQLTGATKTINRSLEAKARAQAGLKGYVTNLEAPTVEYVMAAYHQLWQIEKSFRMSKTDLRARPIYHHKRDSIEAHLTIVMAALAVSQWLERQTSWSIKKLVKTLRRYRSIAVQTGAHILHAGTPLDDDTRAAVRAIKNAAAGH